MPYSEAWDETFPPDTQPAKLLGQDIRSFKTDIRERVGTYLSGLTANMPTPEAVWAGLLFFATDTGIIWQWSGTAWVDVTADFIADITPQVIAFSATPVFPAPPTTFEMTLTGNVTSSTITGLLPGMTLTFILKQDAGGGHTFVWPTNVPGQSIGLAADQVTVQQFIVDDEGNVWLLNPQAPPPIIDVATGSLGANTALPLNTPTSLISVTITFPVGNGRYRVLASFGLPLLMAPSGLDAVTITAGVSDGTAVFASSQIMMTASTTAQGGIAGSQASPSYAAGATVTFQLLAQPNSGGGVTMTALKMPEFGGQAAYLSLTIMESET